MTSSSCSLLYLWINELVFRLLLIKKALVNLLVCTSSDNCVSESMGQISRSGLSRCEMINFKIWYRHQITVQITVPVCTPIDFNWETLTPRPCQQGVIEIFLRTKIKYLFYFNLYFPDYVRWNIFSCAFWSSVLFSFG